MATIYVYNNITDNMETYFRDEFEPMPYSLGNSLTVGEFRGSSKSTVLWTTRSAIEAWNILRSSWGNPIFLGFAFKRIWEGGHGSQSQHYAGVAFDMGQNLTSQQRSQLRTLASNTGVWSYVEPAYLTPTWVHVDKRMGPPACPAGYPQVQRGSKGVYVLILQDALNAVGITGAGLDGVFGQGTEDAVKRFQESQGLTADGVVGCGTWTALARNAKGIGQTPTVVNP